MRRVAHPGIGASLRGDIDRDLPGIRLFANQWHPHFDMAAIYIHQTRWLTQNLGRGKDRRPELHARRTGDKLQSLAVEVIAIGDIPTEYRHIPVDLMGEAKGLIVGQEFLGSEGPGRTQKNTQKKNDDRHSSPKQGPDKQVFATHDR